MELIDKDTIAARIRKLKMDIGNIFNEYDEGFWEGRTTAFDDVICALDTLEMKEVDLEKEIDNYISNNFFGSQTMGFFANRTKEEPNDQDIALCAKHFFELGLSVSNKAEKGKEV